MPVIFDTAIPHYRFVPGAFLHPAVISCMLAQLKRYVMDADAVERDLMDRSRFPRAGNVTIGGLDTSWCGYQVQEDAWQAAIADRRSGSRLCVPRDLLPHMGCDPCTYLFRNDRAAIAALRQWLDDYPNQRRLWLHRCTAQDHAPANLDRARLQAIMQEATAAGLSMMTCGRDVTLAARSPRRLARGICRDHDGNWWAEPGSYPRTICTDAPLQLRSLRSNRRSDIHDAWNAFFAAAWRRYGMSGTLQLPDPTDGCQVPQDDGEDSAEVSRWLSQPQAEFLAPSDAEAAQTEALRVAAASGQLVSYEELQQEGFSPDVITFQLGDPDHVVDGRRYVDHERASAFRASVDVHAPGGQTAIVPRDALQWQAGWSDAMLQRLLGRPPLLRGVQAYYTARQVAAALDGTTWFVAYAAHASSDPRCRTWRVCERQTRSLIQRGQVLWHQLPAPTVTR